MKAIILAAGFGTRLYPITEDTPKALLRLGNKTILDYLIEQLEVSSAVDEIIVVTSGRFYSDFYEWANHSTYQKPIHIVENKAFVPEKRLGAVGDLDLALRSGYCGSDDFLVFCGDNYFDFPLGHFLLPCLGHRENVFVGVYDVGDPSIASSCGVVETDDHNLITDFEEKPEVPKSTRVCIGAYYFPRKYRMRLYEYLTLQKRDPDKIGDFVAWLSKKESLYAVDFDGTWFDIGSNESLDSARRHFNVKESV